MWQVRELVQDFYSSRYASCLKYLRKLKPDFLVDLHLHDHVEPLFEAIQSKARRYARYYAGHGGYGGYDRRRSPRFRHYCKHAITTRHDYMPGLHAMITTRHDTRYEYMAWLHAMTARHTHTP